jgi:hypothetical protein
MTQLLIHLPDNIANRFRSVIPTKQRSKYIENLLIKEFSKKDNELLVSALAIEQDNELNALIEDFDVVTGDGIDEHK